MRSFITDIYLPKTKYKLFKMRDYEVYHGFIDTFQITPKTYRSAVRTIYTKYFGVSIEFEGYFWRIFRYSKYHYPNMFREKSWTFQFFGFVVIFRTIIEKNIEYIYPDFKLT